MAFQVRAARPEDVPAIVEWTTDTFDWGDYVPERLPGWLENPESYVVVAVDDEDRPIGVAHTVMLSPVEAWLEGARVHPDHKRSGMGSAMNQAGTAWARDRGARVARLATEAANTAARGQVEAIGYRHVSTWAVGTLTPQPGSPLLDDERRLRPSHQADVDSAWMSWSLGDLAAAGKELLSLGWRWRHARPEDLLIAADHLQLLQCPSGWMLFDRPQPEKLRTGWLTTTQEDAPLFFEAVVDLVAQRGADSIRVFAPSVPWLVESIARAGGTPKEALIYSLSL